MLSMLSLVSVAAPLAGQQGAAPPPATARNAIYAELGGNGLLYTLNYDRRIRNHVTGRAGLMFISLSGTDEDGSRVEATVAFVPLMVNRLIGSGAGRFELGIGPVFGFAGGEIDDVEDEDVEFTGLGLAAVSSTIGYRYQPLDGGLVFRAGLTPFYSGSLQVWGGLSIGVAF